MAARASGSGADGLVLYNAAEWLNKVHVLDRDCGVQTYVNDVKKCFSDKTCSYLKDSYLENEMGTVSSVIKGDIMKGMVLTRKWDANNQGCVQSSGSMSIVGTDVHTGYRNNAYRAILGPGQFGFVLHSCG